LSAASAHRIFAGRLRSGVLVDVAIAAIALAGSLALLFHGGIGGGQPGQLDWTGGLLAACSTVPLVAWRRAPRAVFVLTASASVLSGGLGYPVGLALGPTAALYLLAASRDEQQPWTRLSTAMVIALFSAYLLATGAGGGGFPGIELLHTGLAWAVAWFAGERTRLRREHIAELRERALRAEQEGERERRLAAAEERARIARDLHDSAGHAINVIALRAGTARLRHDDDPDRGRATLAAIEELARQTAAEIDQIVGALRELGSEGAEIAPPGLASLDTLVAHRMAAGLDVKIATAGTPRPLGVAVDQAAYRILQEGLTNAARHGAGRVRIDLRFDRSALEVTISNPAVPGPISPTSNGHGLIGMRERATLLGGSLDAQRVNGSFCVRACLPYTGRGS
jgi:signal transduction histidine kinase